jgi:hypothetical protein
MFSLNALAAVEHECVYKNIVVTIFTDKENDINVHLIKDGIEFSSCKMKVFNYRDGKTGASLDELINFEKLSCNVTGKPDIEIVSKGFIKSDFRYDTSAAYVINNEQPLNCEIRVVK